MSLKQSWHASYMQRPLGAYGRTTCCTSSQSFVSRRTLLEDDDDWIAGEETELMMKSGSAEAEEGRLESYD